MEKKENKHCLFDTSSWLENIKDTGYYEVFRECREDTDEILDEEVPNMDSQEFMEWAIEDSQREVEDFLENMEWSEHNNGKCVITGRLGLWNGKKEIIPVICDSISEAVLKCITDMDDAEAYIDSSENNCIEVIGHHHDGSNCFEIRKLSQKDIELICEGWDENGDDLPDLTDKSLYEVLPEYLY